MDPINRPRLQADLDRLSASISELLAPLLSKGLEGLPAIARATLLSLLPVATTTGSLSQAISSSFSRLSALTDEDLATLIDALAYELGTLRNARPPLEGASPELAAALERLRQALVA